MRLSCVHIDIKLANFLVQMDANGKYIATALADFGTTRQVGQAIEYLGMTPETVSCEMLKWASGKDKDQRHLGLPLDIWALGCSFYGLYMERNIGWSYLLSAFYSCLRLKRALTLNILKEDGADDSKSDPDWEPKALSDRFKKMEDLVEELPTHHLGRLDFEVKPKRPVLRMYKQVEALDEQCKALLEEAKKQLSHSNQLSLPIHLYLALSSLMDKLADKLLAVFDALGTMPIPDKDNQNPSKEVLVQCLIWQMLHPDPTARPTSQDIVAALFKLG